MIEEETPKEFASSVGKVIPDLVFSLRQGPEAKRWYTWEEDKGSMRGKDECLSKYVGMWWWRKEYCYDTRGQNRWGISNLTMLTNAPDDRRMRELMDQSCKAHPEGKRSRMFLFTSRERWSMAQSWQLFMEPTWFTAWDERAQPLLKE